MCKFCCKVEIPMDIIRFSRQDKYEYGYWQNNPFSFWDIETSKIMGIRNIPLALVHEWKDHLNFWPSLDVFLKICACCWFDGNIKLLAVALFSYNNFINPKKQKWRFRAHLVITLFLYTFSNTLKSIYGHIWLFTYIVFKSLPYRYVIKLNTYSTILRR